jgi:hypothetical protein
LVPWCPQSEAATTREGDIIGHKTDGDGPAFRDAKERTKRAKEARSYRAVYAKEMKEKKKQEREAEKKKEEDELAAVRAEKKKEAAEKIAQQAQRVAADKKVDEMLKKNGFSAQVITRGEADEKKPKEAAR